MISKISLVMGGALAVSLQSKQYLQSDYKGPNDYTALKSHDNNDGCCGVNPAGSKLNRPLSFDGFDRHGELFMYSNPGECVSDYYKPARRYSTSPENHPVFYTAQAD